MKHQIKALYIPVKKAGSYIKLIALASFIFTAQIQAEVVVIVNPDNPIQSLSKKDVQRLFLGRMHKFPNSDMKVESLDGPEDGKDYDIFYSRIIKMSKSKLKRYRAYYLFSGKGRLPTQMKSSEKILTYISNTKNAIAYINKKYVEGVESVKIVYPD